MIEAFILSKLYDMKDRQRSEPLGDMFALAMLMLAALVWPVTFYVFARQAFEYGRIRSLVPVIGLLFACVVMPVVYWLVVIGTFAYAVKKLI